MNQESLLWRAHHQINTTDNNVRDEQLIWKRKEGDQQQFDINILAGRLIALAPVLANLCRGSIGMSGMLPDQGSAVAEVYRRAVASNAVLAKEFNGWVLVTGGKQLYSFALYRLDRFHRNGGTW
jgi:ribosomal protein L11 methylase PrmA